jgi:antitoxin CptB
MRDPSDLRRLRWRCRRGMKELDVLLERYLAQAFPTADVARREAFARLLELPDPELHAQIVGEAPAMDEVTRDVIGSITRRAP